MATWQTTTTVKGQPEHVLEVLTDPSSARRWSPVGFDTSAVVRVSAAAPDAASRLPMTTRAKANRTRMRRR